MLPRISFIRIIPLSLLFLPAFAAWSEPAPTPQDEPVAVLEGVAVSSEVIRGVIIEWPTEPGASYSVQWTDELGPNGWLDLLDVDGDGSPQTVFDEVDAVGPSFYRIIKNP